MINVKIKESIFLKKGANCSLGVEIIFVLQTFNRFINCI